jgi:DNA end-binding protein Ku
VKTIVNAVLQIGLVTVPVGVVTAAKEKETKFRTLHDNCGLPLSRTAYCSHCDENVPSEHVVRGYEYAKGEFLSVDEAALELVTADKSKLIKMRKFVHYDDVPQIYQMKRYWLAPSKLLASTYELFEIVLADTGRAAIGTATLWGKEYPCMIHAEGGVLALTMLWCADEVVWPNQEIGSLLKGDVSVEERELARDLVLALSGNFDATTDLVSESKSRVDHYLAELMSGNTPDIPEPVEAKTTVDVLKSLKESLEAARA